LGWSNAGYHFRDDRPHDARPIAKDKSEPTTNLVAVPAKAFPNSEKLRVRAIFGIAVDAAQRTGRFPQFVVVCVTLDL